MRLLLLVSLAFNLLIVGLVAGALLSRGDHRAPRFALDLGPYARALDPEDRREVAQKMRRDGEFHPPGPRTRRANLEAFMAALTAEPFDIGAVSELLEAQRGQLSRLTEAAHDAFVAHLAEMSAADRAAFAERLSQDLRGRPER